MNWMIQTSQPLKGVVKMPGDKSISHRALMCAVMADGVSRIHGFLRAGVTDAMLRCVGGLGVEVEWVEDDLVATASNGSATASCELDCGNSGTTARLLMGMLAGQADRRATLSGTEGLSRRPMRRVTEPLRLMGAQIEGDVLPLMIHGQRLRGISYTLPVASAQVKAALLFAALQADSQTTIHEPIATRDHSELMLRVLGVPLHRHDHTIVVEPIDAPLSAFELHVPGDISSAAFVLSAGALIEGSDVTVQGIGINPTRMGLLGALSAMGASVTIDRSREMSYEPIADVRVQGSALHAIDVGGEMVVRMIDEMPIFAVLATQAEGVTTVRDAAELRVKESDRIAALVCELRKLGADIEEHTDGFAIEGPTRLHGAVVDSHGDHRLAMALAVAGMIGSGEMTIMHAEIYRESFPNFVEVMRDLGGRIA